MNASLILEAVMLACFGLAWPLACLRMLRYRRAEGRGLLPTGLVLLGYAAGMVAKVNQGLEAGAFPPVFWMYLLNASSVAANLALQWHYGRAPRVAAFAPAGAR